MPWKRELKTARDVASRDSFVIQMLVLFAFGKYNTQQRYKSCSGDRVSIDEVVVETSDDRVRLSRKMSRLCVYMYCMCVL